MRGDIPCPQGWTECELCDYYRFKQCEYGFVEDIVDLKEIAVKLEQEIIKKAKQDAGVIKSKTPLVSADSKTFWNWWGKTSHKHMVNEKDVILPLGGPVSFGGGGIKRKKSKRGNKPTVHVWGEIL